MWGEDSMYYYMKCNKASKLLLLIESKLPVVMKTIGQGLLVIFLLFAFTILILHVLICLPKKKNYQEDKDHLSI